MNLINNLIEQCKLIRNGNFRVSSEVLLERSLFPSEPYEHGEVKQFIREIKYGRLDLVEKMIKDDPLLVFQYDDMHQTGFMWAVKWNNLLMARFLLKKFSRVNFKDLTGRTALNFAVQNNNL